MVHYTLVYSIMINWRFTQIPQKREFLGRRKLAFFMRRLYAGWTLTMKIVLVPKE